MTKFARFDVLTVLVTHVHEITLKTEDIRENVDQFTIVHYIGNLKFSSHIAIQNIGLETT